MRNRRGRRPNEVEEVVAVDGEVLRADGAPQQTPLRRIWLCADDYGISPSVNAAIRDLVIRGRLNATSVMMVAPSLDRAEARALSLLNGGLQRVAVGLHLTLTGPFRPLTAFRPLRNGAFLPLDRMVTLAVSRRLERAALAAEMEAQLSGFAAVFGQAPEFVDGHHHVHLLPQIRDELLAAMKRLAPLAWVRQCGSALPTWQLARDYKVLALSWLSRGFRKRAQARSVPTNPAFAGAYEFRPEADFAGMFPRFLEGLPDGGLVMCHPGRVDAELERLDPLTDLREKEYTYLAGDGFTRALDAARVTLA